VLRLRLAAIAIAMIFLTGTESTPAAPAHAAPPSSGVLPYAAKLSPAALRQSQTNSASSPGRIDSTTTLRYPDGPYAPFTVSDATVFTGDLAGGLWLRVSGAMLHDTWTFKYFHPGSSQGGPPDEQCSAEILGPGEPGNSSGLTALLAFCGAPAIVVTFTNGCPCSMEFGLLAILKGYPFGESAVGVWNIRVDFLGGDGTQSLGVALSRMNLIYTPAVLTVHGWESDCGAIGDLMALIRRELRVIDGQVACAKYDSRAGVKSGASVLQTKLREFRSRLNLPQSYPVQIVAHSLGGLVARYYFQKLHVAEDGPIGSISMLGTPNNGVKIAFVDSVICPHWTHIIPFRDKVCTTVDFATGLAAFVGLPDIHSQAVKDLKPGSDILDKKLNKDFVLPTGMIMRAHAGTVNTPQGALTSLDGDNDCFVGRGSVEGPNAIFRAGGFLYPTLHHADLSFGPFGVIAFLSGCGEPTLTNDVELVDNLLPDLKGLTLPASTATLPAAAPGADSAQQLVSSVLGQVSQGQQATHDIAVPAGLGDAQFSLFWMYESLPTSLTVTLARPDGSVVQTGQPGVTSLDSGGAGVFFANMIGFAITAPPAGTWHLTVAGATVPNTAEAYLAMLTTESVVELVGDAADDFVPAGTAEAVRAQLLDNGTAVAASVSATAMLLDDTSAPISMHDDGVAPDGTAGDHIYSGSLTTGPGCGTYRIKISASGATSEGGVSRESWVTFEGSVAGDAVRDPCNPDDDADGLTDANEENVLRTAPLVADTDGDGVSDGAEVSTGTDPLREDTDRDGFKDKAATLHKGPANTDTSVDNCPLAPNASQANADGNFVDLPSRFAYDDVTWPMSDAAGDACDTDDDNDRLSDAQEASLGPGGANHALCAAATANTDPAKADTDGDTYLDGAECALGFDPRNAASRPPYLPPLEVDADRDGLPDAFEASIGADPAKKDTDGDTIADGVEFMFYGTNPNATNSDGDACSDVKEVASVNGDSIVSASDIGLIAGAFGPNTSPNYVLDFDVNKDGVITAGDVGFAAAQFGAC
jgi:hypothetical protein